MSGRASLASSVILCLLLPPVAHGQQPPGPPPAPVVVAPVKEGKVAPEAEFVGTLYYPEVSEVSAEVSGNAVEVRIEDGQRVGQGDILVRLDDELLGKTAAAMRASREQVLAEVEKAERDFNRMERLRKDELIPEQVHDEHRYLLKSLEKRAESLKADLERLEAERRRKTIHAPFAGIVVRRKVDRGEWVSPGGSVATLARDDTMDAVVEVPGELLPYLSRGMALGVRAGGSRMNGRVTAVVPRGDVATRSFPVKVRIPNRRGLVEGMEARVDVPSGKKISALLISRDALVTQAGSTAVYTVADGRARVVPVKVLRYLGKEVAVEPGGLRAGQDVVVKGNERLRDGQPVAAGRGRPDGAASGAPAGKRP